MSRMRHPLQRPSWRCTGCGEPWPCAMRREELLRDYGENLDELRVMLTGFLAYADAPGTDPEALRRQLLGWLPPREVHPHVKV